jgi:hypothetical protein
MEEQEEKEEAEGWKRKKCREGVEDIFLYIFLF